MGKQAQIKLGQIEIPKEYFQLAATDKQELCEYLLDKIFIMVDKNMSVKMDRDFAVNQIIESSLITNEKEENYEFCQVLMDIKKLLKE